MFFLMKTFPRSSRIISTTLVIRVNFRWQRSHGGICATQDAIRVVPTYFGVFYYHVLFLLILGEMHLENMSHCSLKAHMNRLRIVKDLGWVKKQVFMSKGTTNPYGDSVRPARREIATSWLSSTSAETILNFFERTWLLERWG